MESRWIQRTKARLRKLLQSQPQQITGRQIFFREMVRKSQALNTKSARLAFTSAYVMQRHGHHWNELRPEVRASYEQRALVARSVKEVATQEAIEEHETNLTMASASTPEAHTCGAMQASNCHLAAEALQQMQQLWDSAIYGTAVVKDRQQAALKCPPRLSDEDFTALVQSSSLGKRMPLEWCTLTRRLAQCRVELSHSVIACVRDGVWHWYKYCLATLQPVQLVLIPLQELDLAMVGDPAKTIQDWRRQQCQDFQQAWSYSHGEFECQDVFAELAVTDCYLVRQVVHQGPGILTTNSCLEPLGPFLQGRELEKKLRSKAKAAPSAEEPAHKKQVLSGLPAWMGVTHGSANREATSTASSSSGQNPDQIGTEGAADPSEPGVTEEVPLQEIWDTMDEARAAAPNDTDQIADCFREQLLGGAWQIQRTGRVVYGLQSVIKPNNAVHDVAVKFRLPKSAAFEYNIYGEVPASHLSLLWRTRMFFLAEHWVCSGRPRIYPLDSLPQFLLPDALQQQVHSYKGRLAKRRDTILGLLPGSGASQPA